MADAIENNTVESQVKGRNVCEEEAMVLPSLASRMNVDFVLNGDGSVWILHDQPFSHYLKWVEYDAADNNVTIVTQEGKMQPLGLHLPDAIIPALSQTERICITQLRDEKIWDVYVLPFLVTEAVLN